MKISRFRPIFPQWGRHSEVLVIYPESCCALFWFILLVDLGKPKKKKLSLTHDTWNLTEQRFKHETWAFNPLGKSFNSQSFRLTIRHLFQELEYLESVRMNPTRKSQQTIFNTCSKWASKMPPAVESIISVAKAAPPTFSLRQREDTHHFFQVRRNGWQKHPKQKKIGQQIFCLCQWYPMINSTFCGSNHHFGPFQKNMKDDVKWWRDPINITWKHFARQPAQYCRSPAPCRCCRIGIWDPTSEAPGADQEP